MKKLLSLVLALSMVLGLCTVGYAEDASVHEDEAVVFSEDFETGVINNKVWNTNSRVTVVQKEKDGNAGKYAGKQSVADAGQYVCNIFFVILSFHRIPLSNVLSAKLNQIELYQIFLFPAINKTV